MGLVIIFALITVLGVFGVLSSLRTKNVLSLFFALGTVAVLGWFTIMTVVNSGYPAA